MIFGKKNVFLQKKGLMSKLIKILIFSILTTFSVALLSCKPKLRKTVLSGEAQGSYYAITYYDYQNRDFSSSIDSLLHDFDRTASLWMENSLIRKVNGNQDSVINDLFCDLLQLSIEVNKTTGGYFDCTVGQLVNAWGFGFRNGSNVDSAAVDSLKQFIGLPVTVSEENGRKILHKARPEMEIDFNAIAQGYSVDMVSKFLEDKGITSYIVDIGGEVMAKGNKPDGGKWVVGVEKPSEDKFGKQKIDIKINLENQSVVTSGNYRKYYEKNGVKYSHTIDPFTGYPVNHSLLSVSVISDYAWKADAYATAFMVMGLDKSLDFIEKHPELDAVYFIYDENGEYKTLATDRFKQHIVKQ